MPSAARKASVTSLSTSTSRNGPKGFGAGRPKSWLRNSAEARGSLECTMVWLSLMAITKDKRHHKVITAPAARYSRRVTCCLRAKGARRTAAEALPRFAALVLGHFPRSVNLCKRRPARQPAVRRRNMLRGYAARALLAWGSRPPRGGAYRVRLAALDRAGGGGRGADLARARR